MAILIAHLMKTILRSLLEKNLLLLHKLSQSPSFLNDCPPDLQARLVDVVRSDEYLTRLKCLQQSCIEGGYEFPFKESSEVDYQSADILVNVDSEKPSWWVLVKDEVEPINIEERSGIDDENYVVIGEEHVVDGVANFMAKCILSNLKARNLSLEELQKMSTMQQEMCIKGCEKLYASRVLAADEGLHKPPKIKVFVDKVIQCPLLDIAIPLSGFQWEYNKHFKLSLALIDPEVVMDALETLSALVKINHSKLHGSARMVGCGLVNGYLLSLAQVNKR